MDDDKPKKPLLGRDDYFRRSREQGLPNRCPILSRCERHTQTYKLVRERERGSYQVDGPAEPVVPIVGEDICLAGGTNNFFLSNVCPEVALFDSNRFFMGLGGYATIKGHYDKYMDPQTEVLETGHFSECAEYALDVYQAANRTREAGPNQRHSMTNNTFNISGSVQGGAVSLGGDAHNSGSSEFQGNPELARQRIVSELDGLERAIQTTPLADPEKQQALAEIAAVKVEPSPDKVKKLLERFKTVADIGNTIAPFLTAITQMVG